MTPTGVRDPHAPHVDQNAVQCYVCEADLSEKGGATSVKSKSKDQVKPGLVEIKSEGTGFSGAGGNTVEKSGVAFQC